MANTNLVHDLILKEGIRCLRNNTSFINALSPQYDDSYKYKGAKAGSELRIATPKEYSVRSGKTIDVQNDEERSVTISKSIQRGVDLKFSSAELTQDISMISKTKIAPAMATLAAYWDNYCMNEAIQEVYQAVTLPTGGTLDRADILNAGVKLDNGCAPRDASRCVILNPQGQADVVADLVGLFQSSDKIASQYNDGAMGRGLGFDFKMSQNVPSLTQGAANTSYVVAAGIATDGGSTVDVETGSGAFVAGDIITIASVNSVNPLTKVSTGQLQDFTVTAASAGGTVTLSVTPSFELTGPYQNIDALPVAAAAVTTKGTLSTAYPRNIAFHPGFAAFATADLDLPGGTQYSGRKVEDGLSMRLVADYDIKNDDTYYRFDILGGYKTIIPRWAAWIYGV